ncbi:MAG: DUF3300 domain-containing protein [Verrucomicrobiota bacterium]
MKNSIPLKGVIALCIASATLAQHGIAQPSPAYPASAAVILLTASELQDLVGRFALYPDDLIALILPASTTPLDIVKAQRFLTKYAADKSLKPDPALSEPVMNLLTYPDVINLLGDDLDWTQNLGQAVTDQQVDVLSAIQIFRRKAQSAGNLKTDDKLTVVVEENIVQIVPTKPEVIYVPQYQPASVVVVQSAPAIVYAPTPYPVYYHPGAAIATAAAIGYLAGSNNAYGCNWYGGGIYVAPRVAHYGHIQDERMDYANNAREDWQDYGKANREDWQKHSNNAQSKRQDAAASNQRNRQDAASSNQGQRQDAIRDTTSANQGQRQDAIAGGRDQRTANQGQRQDSISGAQDKRGANQGQRQSAAQENQGQRQSAAQNRLSFGDTPPRGQNWQPSAQTRPTTGAKSGAATANRNPGEARGPKQQSAATQFGTKQSSRSPAGAYGGASSGSRAQIQSARGERSMSGASRSGGGGNRGGGGGGRSRGR